jgi:hypothetical protein
MCPICNTLLTPIVYTTDIDDVLINMDRIGQIILVDGKPRSKAPRSYCKKCHTGYQSEVPLDNTVKNIKTYPQVCPHIEILSTDFT